MSARVADDDNSACGTDRGFARHRKRREPACPPCRDAHNAYQRAYYKITSRRRAEARWKAA